MPIRQVLIGLGVEGEYCAEAVTAVERVTYESYQIVIIDWDKQPEAGLLLTTARERKASERPLTLAIVSDDADIPKALQAGANSILHKPLLISQIKDTLTTARDLLRAKQDSAAAQGAAAGATACATAGAGPPAGIGEERTLRAGEFLQSAAPTPGGHIVVESGAPELADPSTEPVEPLKELEPMAAAVTAAATNETAVPPAAPPPDEPHGLNWYLKRAGALPPVPGRAAASPPTSKPELIGFDQTPSHSVPVNDRHNDAISAESPPEHERKAEERLFAYIDGEEREPEERPKRQFRLGKSAVMGALLLAACAVIAAPQAPWHTKLGGVWARGRRALHVWLNPQPVTPPQAPESHENFGRAGDEYKLPVAEAIPDATTDPTQIRVVPLVDPTAKKTNNAGANADQSTASSDGASASPSDQSAQAPAAQAQENQPAQPASDTGQPGAPAGTAQPAITQPSGSTISAANATTEQPHPNPPTVPSSLLTPPPSQPAAVQSPVPHVTATPTYVSVPANVPSSLKSQMASMTPEASGNKAPETALPSIEPVDVPEATERGLLATQPAIAYPANAKGQQGTVVLQVLIGRDGTVQDAKFLQGSLAFARAAINGVKQWTFKPYVMNGRAVSVQTSLTMSFKPGQ